MTKMPSRIKSESTASGLLTPAGSFASRSSATLKRERIDLTSIDDVEEAPTPSTNSHNTPSVTGEEIAEQQRRSAAVSVRTSRPPNTRTHHTMLHEQDGPASRLLTGGEGLEVVGRDVNRLVSLIDKLRRIGLKSVDGALPELILCGDQSAGKSSLMGAIAEISLPKKESMCTRCPTNIKTSPAAEWGCTVSLQITYAFEPTKKSGQFPYWKDTEGLTSILFKEIQAKDELQEVLEWAQVALLNPTKEIETFVPGTREQEQKKQEGEPFLETQFSPNVIAVEIRGPNLPALSFFDLPGLFHAAEETSHTFLVKAFRDLTIKYIKHPNAIVICALTMKNDPHASATKALITDHKAEKKCIGVLTMPDLVTNFKDYNNILHGKTFVLPRGYFVTKQPASDSALTGDNYHVLARQDEEEFFNTSEKFGMGGDWEQFRDRCGTSNIQKYLSRKFAKQILMSIPDLTDKINAQTYEVENELASLPETPNDKVQHIVRQRLRAFTNEVTHVFDGNSKRNENLLHSKYTKLCNQFLKATEIMRPGLNPTHPSDRLHAKASNREVIDLDSDAESVVSQKRTTTPRSRDVSESPNKRPRLTDTPIRLNLSSSGSSSLGTPINRSTKRESQFGAMNPPDLRLPSAALKLKDDEIGRFRQQYLGRGTNFMSIGEIRDSIEKHSRTGFPGDVNDKVMEVFALQAVYHWDGPLRTFIDETFVLLRDQILSTLTSELRDHQYTDLYKQSREFVEDLLSTYEKEQREISTDFYNIEKSSVFTINNQAFYRYKLEALSVLKERRRQHRIECYADVHFHPKFNDQRDDQAKKEWMKKVKDEQLGPDPFEKEIEVAAWIRGYYTTARYRFVDSVCANMSSKFFKKIVSGLNYYLEEKFGLDQGDGEAICQALLEGNAERARRRIQLKNKRDQLAEFSRTLDELRNDTFADDDACVSDAFDDDEMMDDVSSATAVGTDTPSRRIKRSRE